ncbi:S8/S53 family peptidase [Amycolatopsis sp. NPDC024027]|uniref:S8/S53 family peptidase n=1 Tax=Amycolatopsis sp. NPDC024027 TaxID=3154327 RepID=UPI0033F989B2
MTDQGGRQGGAATLQLHSLKQLIERDVEVSADVVVGVVDTGVVVLGGKPHPYIEKNLVDGWQGNEDVLPEDLLELGRFDGHGTFVAGLIKHEAPTVQIDMRRGLDLSDARKSDQVVADCIRALAGVDNLRVVNLSFFGEAAEEKQEPVELKSALEELFGKKPGVVVVTAVANRWTADRHWPAAFTEYFPRLIAVGATDESVTPVPGLRPPRASFCSWWDGVDVFAGGCGVLGPSVLRRIPGLVEQDTFSYSTWSGASFAAAKVSGLLAKAFAGGARSAEDAIKKVIPPSLPRIPLPGQSGDKPVILGNWPSE